MSGDASKLTKDDFDRHQEISSLEASLLERWEELSLVIDET